MKIIHINFSGRGGAANAMQRLHTGLLGLGIDSEVWCDRDAGNIPRALLLKNQFWRKLDSLKNLLIQKFVFKVLGLSGRSLNIFPSLLVRRINRSDADIVHLHWINAEMVRIEQLKGIKKPLVWTFHDMWPFCGAEHCTWEERFKSGYQPLTAEKGSWPDVDRWVFKRKERTLKLLPFQIVCPGNWLSGMVRESFLYGGRDIRTISNGLDLDEYRPMPKSACREEMAFPQDKILVLFGASDAKAHHKGFDLFRNSLEYLEQGLEIEIICFGGEFGDSLNGFKVHPMGVVKSPEMVVKLYNAADVVVVPSRMESFGQVALEAMACGVPVVAFDATGLKDIVRHGETGALAEPYCPKSLARQIHWILSLDRSTYAQMGREARRRACEVFGRSVVAERYATVYRGLLSEGLDREPGSQSVAE